MANRGGYLLFASSSEYLPSPEHIHGGFSWSCAMGATATWSNHATHATRLLSSGSAVSFDLAADDGNDEDDDFEREKCAMATEIH